MAKVVTLPGWETALFSVVGHLLNSSALDPVTKTNLNGTLAAGFQVVEDAPQEAGAASAAAVGLGAQVLETAAPDAAPFVAAVAPMGEAAVSDIVSGVVAGFERTFAAHNASLLEGLKGLVQPQQ